MEKVTKMGKKRKGFETIRHPDRDCGDCEVRLQLGSPPELKNKHRMPKDGRMNHPGDNSAEWLRWLLKGECKSLDLRHDSCLCKGCGQDCRQQEREMPRYHNQLQKLKKTEQHCFLCHEESPSCQCKDETFCSDWKNKVNLVLFEHFLQEHFQQDLAELSETEQQMCWKHMRRAIAYENNLTCSVCQSQTTSKWIPVKTSAASMNKVFRDASLLQNQLQYTSVICKECSDIYSKKLKPTRKGDIQSENPELRAYSRAVQ